jgi:hypothetical protein
MQKAYTWLIVGALLSSCSAGPTFPSSNIAGKYNGNFAIDGADPSVIALTTFTVDASGNLSGTTNVQGSSASNGTLKGTVTGSNDLSLTFNITFESETLGKYTMTGTGAYSAIQKVLGAQQLPAKNASGTFIGNAVLGGTKE